jgi:hypothetical protein
VGKPIREEYDVANLLVQNAVDDLKEFAGQDRRIASDTEEAAAEEGLGAFGVPEVRKAAVWCLSDFFRARRRNREAVSREQVRQNSGMTGFLVCLQGESVADDRIARRIRDLAQEDACAELIPESIAPDRHSGKELTLFLGKRRPEEIFWLILQVTPGQVVTEEFFVGWASDSHCASVEADTARVQLSAAASGRMDASH